jgi:peptidoglycan-binding protein ArfA
MLSFRSFLIVTCCMSTLALLAQGGLKAEYFSGENFDRLVGTRVEKDINQSWLDAPPMKGVDPQSCSVRWTGFLKAPESGAYTFSAFFDDGIRLWIGDQLVIDQWGLNDKGEISAKARLVGGQVYALKVEYFNGLVEGEIKLMWTLPSQQSVFGSYFTKSQVVDAQYFNHKVEQIIPPKPKKEKPAPPTQEKPKPKPVPPATPKPAPVAKPSTNTLAATQINRDTIEKYIPKNVHFKQSKAIILSECLPDLDQLANFLGRYSAVRVKIEGHTDIIGEAAVNQKLSEDRAATVARYLTEKGVSAARITSIGYGSTRPLFPDDKEKGNSKNRRVVFLLE